MKKNFLQVWQNIMLTIIAMAMMFYLFVGSAPVKQNEQVDVNIVSVNLKRNQTIPVVVKGQVDIKGSINTWQ